MIDDDPRFDCKHLAMFYVDERYLVPLLAWNLSGDFDAFKALHVQGVPDGAKVAGVFHDPMRRAFGVVLEHQGFYAAPAGTAIMVLDSINLVFKRVSDMEPV